MSSVVFMGVAGCGKSSLAQAVAAAAGLRLVEGDAFHSAASRAKMSCGQALTDDDRREWLSALAVLLAGDERLALACSALKRSYRERLRERAPGLRFVFLRIDEAEAQRRVAARADTHFFPPALVRNQFETLEDPSGEPGVLSVDATAPLPALRDEVLRWLG